MPAVVEVDGHREMGDRRLADAADRDRRSRHGGRAGLDRDGIPGGELVAHRREVKQMAGRHRRARAGRARIACAVVEDDRRWRLLSLPVLGWILYDFANTIFSFVVVTRYYNDWIIEERGQPDIYVGLMVAAVSVALVVTLPLLGALADRLGRHKPILIAFTLLSVVATGAARRRPRDLAGAARRRDRDVRVQQLRRAVPPAAQRRRAGVQAGPRLGNRRRRRLPRQPDGAVSHRVVRARRPCAAGLPARGRRCSALFALPCFFLVRERPKPRPEPGEQAPARPFAQLAATVRRARGAPHGRLLLARFFYVDAIATVLAYLTVYARRTGDFDGGSIDALLAISAVVAIAGAIGGGILAERFGPKRVIVWTLDDRGRLAVRGGRHGDRGAAVGRRAARRASCSARCRPSIACSCCGSCPRSAAARTSASTRSSASSSTGFGPLVLWGGTILLMHDALGLSKFDASRVAVLVLVASALVGAADPAPARRRSSGSRPPSPVRSGD